jgi:hypothetical protein
MPPTERRTWTLDNPCPAGASMSSLNKRTQHRYATADRAAWRKVTKEAAMAARLPYGLGKCHLTALLRFRTNRVRDANNYAGLTKVIVDALVSRGTWLGDDDRYVIGPDHRMGELLPKGKFQTPGRVILVIRELGV